LNHVYDFFATVDLRHLLPGATVPKGAYSALVAGAEFARRSAHAPSNPAKGVLLSGERDLMVAMSAAMPGVVISEFAGEPESERING